MFCRLFLLKNTRTESSFLFFFLHFLSNQTKGKKKKRIIKPKGTIETKENEKDTEKKNRNGVKVEIPLRTIKSHERNALEYTKPRNQK